LARFQVGTVRKSYMNKKRVYEYKRISLNVPRRFHKLVEPFLKEELQMTMTAEKGVITITLSVGDEKK
jgi:hypothetical protein